jgi:hypothetical protein
MLISDDVQQEELWDFTAMREAPSEEKDDEYVFR